MSTTEGQQQTPAPPRPRLTRSRDDRVLAGVCGGLGRYFDIDPVIFRIAFAALLLVGGTSLLLYGAAWVLLPEDGHRHSIGEGWVRHGRRRHVLPVALIVIGGLVLAGNLRVRPHGFGIVLAAGAVVLGVAMLRRHPTQGSDTPGAVTPVAAGPDEPPTEPASASPPALPPPPPTTEDDWLGSPPPPPPEPKGRSTSTMFLSIVLIGGGVVALLHAAGVLSVSVPVFLAGALILTGIALVVSAWTGGTGGLVVIGILLTIALAVASVVRVPLSGRWGERRWVPSTLEQVHSSYRHGVGDVVIDFSHVTFPPEGRSVNVRQGVGHIRVIVPPNSRVAVTAHAGVGELHLLGHRTNGSGIKVDDTVVSGNGEDGTLRLLIDLGAGAVDVDRAEALTPRLPEGLTPPPTVGVPR